MVTLGVADLARARAFYEALGWGGPSSRTTRSRFSRQAE
jgi:catechol 2,3-dioxygenase-like lactoylglutathione lyase family enzyme